MLITYSTQYAKPHTILILGFLLCMQLHCRIATAKEKAQNDHDQGDQEKSVMLTERCFAVSYVPQFPLIQTFAAQSTDRTLTLLCLQYFCTPSLDKAVVM